jgi:hypothetical protein
MAHLSGLPDALSSCASRGRGARCGRELEEIAPGLAGFLDVVDVRRHSVSPNELGRLAFAACLV